jgi:hypothetical protein
MPDSFIVNKHVSTSAKSQAARLTSALLATKTRKHEIKSVHFRAFVLSWQIDPDRRET